MPHSRTDTAQDDIALLCLSGCEFKAYRYLVNRADPIGVSYPKIETIAAAIGYGVREVQRALDVLNDNDVIRYRRKNAFNPVTRRKESNVYQVNPDILVIAEAFEAEARSEWDALINQCGNVSIGLWSHINQHQEPTPITSVINQRQNHHHRAGAASNANDQGQSAVQNGAAAGNGKSKTDSGRADSETPTSAKRNGTSKSSVPPERPKFTNPKAVNQEFVSEEHESLAKLIRDLGIGLPLARGFVVEYGVGRVTSALDETVAMGTEARKPAALFRSILQTRLADEFAVARQKHFSQQKNQR